MRPENDSKTSFVHRYEGLRFAELLTPFYTGQLLSSVILDPLFCVIPVGSTTGPRRQVIA